MLGGLAGTLAGTMAAKVSQVVPSFGIPQSLMCVSIGVAVGMGVGWQSVMMVIWFKMMAHWLADILTGTAQIAKLISSLSKDVLSKVQALRMKIWGSIFFLCLGFTIGAFTSGAAFGWYYYRLMYGQLAADFGKWMDIYQFMAVHSRPISETIVDRANQMESTVIRYVKEQVLSEATFQLLDELLAGLVDNITASITGSMASQTQTF